MVSPPRRSEHHHGKDVHPPAVRTTPPVPVSFSAIEDATATVNQPVALFLKPTSCTRCSRVRDASCGGGMGPPLSVLVDATGARHHHSDICRRTTASHLKPSKLSRSSSSSRSSIAPWSSGPATRSHAPRNPAQWMKASISPGCRPAASPRKPGGLTQRKGIEGPIRSAVARLGGCPLHSYSGATSGIGAEFGAQRPNRATTW